MVDNKILYFVIIGLLLVIIGLVLHNYEAYAVVRCDNYDGEVNGKVKLDDFILSKIGGRTRMSDTDDYTSSTIYSRECYIYRLSSNFWWR